MKTRLIIGIFAVGILILGSCGGMCGAEARNKETYFYRKFEPVQGEPVPYRDFVTDYCYIVDGVTVMVGYYPPGSGGIFSQYDTADDWGDRLLCFGPDGELIFHGRGVMDVYLYKPHFFSSPDGKEIIILCQLAFEYYFGADAFLLSGGEINRIGEISIESVLEEESPLTDFIVIERHGNDIRFSFPFEKIVYDPARTCVEIENEDYIYIYRNGELIWTGPTETEADGFTK
ncbi:MAG: hypothetical protein LUD76_05540 [Alistipes sp.]|nr:hypothetical protein [Alistipes sp.]